MWNRQPLQNHQFSWRCTKVRYCTVWWKSLTCHCLAYPHKSSQQPSQTWRMTWTKYTSEAYEPLDVFIALIDIHMLSRTQDVSVRSSDLFISNLFHAQVWYSAAWALPTLEAFRSAIAAVLNESSTGVVSNKSDVGNRRVTLPADVELLLRHWQVADVALAASRVQWLHSQERTHVWIGSLKRKVTGQGKRETTLPMWCKFANSDWMCGTLQIGCNVLSIYICAHVRYCLPDNHVYHDWMRTDFWLTPFSLTHSARMSEPRSEGCNQIADSDLQHLYDWTDLSVGVWYWWCGSRGHVTCIHLKKQHNLNKLKSLSHQCEP